MNSSRFKTKKVTETITVGECLKRKREELNMLVEEAGKKLQIKKEYLQYIEEGNYSQLPPSVYTRGFIRSYAKLVGLDSERLISLYNKELAFENRIGKKKKDFNAGQDPKRELPFGDYPLITPKLLTIVLSLIAIVVVGYYLFHQISSFSSTPYLFVSSPVSEEVVKENKIAVKGETEKDANLKINGEEVFVDPNGFFQEDIMLQPGKNTLIIEVSNKFNRTSREKIDIIFEENPKSDMFNSGEKRGEDSIYMREKALDVEGKIKGDEDLMGRKIEVIGP